MSKIKVYVASSWRNPRQGEVIKSLRSSGFDVYDFRHPGLGDTGFHWSDIDPQWKSWSPETFREALQHPIAINGRKRDTEALEWSNAVMLVMPCGRSSHLELGWAIGAGKRTAILLSDGEPELMYGMVGLVTISLGHIIHWLDPELHSS